MDQRALLVIYPSFTSFECGLLDSGGAATDGSLGSWLRAPAVQSRIRTRGSLQKGFARRTVVLRTFRNMDTAQLAKIRTRLGPKYICVFETRFQDGFILECSNASSLEMFAPDSTHRVFRFPQLRFPLDLYRIHQRLRERFSVDRRAILGSTTEELEHYLARAETIHQRIAATDYKLDKDCDRYVYTIRGAIRHAWLLTWPVKDIRRLRVEARAMKTADDLGLPIHPKFGRLRESVRSEIELLRG